ncbi:MAG: hypothetical protein K1X54_11015 [Flavobacteriales bacterium]|nr:hypothetical protein [Flavobacteriales bacterium]
MADRKMKNEIIILVICIFSFNTSFSQKGVFFGFGADVGYKGVNNTYSFVVDIHYRNRISLYFGNADDKFSGFGWGGGINLHLLNTNWQPVIGCGYNTLKSNSFYTGEDSLSRSDYFVPRSRNVVAIIGVHKILRDDDGSANRFASVTPYISYRYSLEDNEVILLDGFNNGPQRDKINRRTGPGFGFGLKLVVVFAKKENIPQPKKRSAIVD